MEGRRDGGKVVRGFRREGKRVESGEGWKVVR